MNGLMCAELPKSKYAQTQGSRHLISANDKSVTIMHVGGMGARKCRYVTMVIQVILKVDAVR